MIKFVQKKVIRLDVTNKNVKDFTSWMLTKQSNFKELFCTLPYFKITRREGKTYIDLILSLKYDVLEEVFETKRKLYSEEAQNYKKLFDLLIKNDFKYNLLTEAEFVYYNNYAKRPKDKRAEN